MRSPSDFSVSANAVKQARQCGLWGDTEARVRGIAAHAAPMPHASGNAAYGPFVLLLRGTHVEAFTMQGPQTVDDRPITACRICRGLMTIRIQTVLDGQEGLAYRPCPRAFDTTQPLCDSKRRTTDAD